MIIERIQAIVDEAETRGQFRSTNCIQLLCIDCRVAAIVCVLDLCVDDTVATATVDTGCA